MIGKILVCIVALLSFAIVGCNRNSSDEKPVVEGKAVVDVVEQPVDVETVKELVLQKMDPVEEKRVVEEKKTVEVTVDPQPNPGARGGFAQMSQEQREAMRARMLERFDTDKDGEISDSEREAMRSTMRNNRGNRADRARTEEERKAIMDKYDLDKDGALSEGEMAIMRQQRRNVGDTQENVGDTQENTDRPQRRVSGNSGNRAEGRTNPETAE